MSGADIGPPRLRRIVFGYTVDCFPSQLILGYTQLKRMLERAGYDVTVSLSPLDDLPSDADILLVPTALAEAARRISFPGRLRVCDDFINLPWYAELIKQLEKRQEWTAPLGAQRPQGESGQVIVYRGYERIE